MLDELIPLVYNELRRLAARFMRRESQGQRKARIVEMKFSGGLTNEEVAEVLKVTSRTVERGDVKQRHG